MKNGNKMGTLVPKGLNIQYFIFEKATKTFIHFIRRSVDCFYTFSIVNFMTVSGCGDQLLSLSSKALLNRDLSSDA